MKTRFILFRRHGVYYCEDTLTRKQSSLKTRNEADARVVLNAKNESYRQTGLNVQIARAYLTASDPAWAQRTWQTPSPDFCRRCRLWISQEPPCIPAVLLGTNGQELRESPHGSHKRRWV